MSNDLAGVRRKLKLFNGFRVSTRLSVNTAHSKIGAKLQMELSERRLAEQQLGICEGSDWFWWFGDYNPSLSVQAFDRLFRLNLSNLYRLLKLPAPVELQHTISVGKGAPAMGGTMRRSTQ